MHKQLIKEAKLLKHNWTGIIEKRVELKEKGSTYEVKLDAISASFRKKAVNLMLEAIQEKPTFQEKVDLNLVIISKEKASSSQSNILVVIELIEKYLFFSNGKRTSNPYRKSVRKLTFDLKGNKGGLRDSLAHLLLDTPCYKSVSKIIKEHLST